MYEFTGTGFASKHSVAKEDFPPVTKVEFVEVWHPREYNFMNDQVKIKLRNLERGFCCMGYEIHRKELEGLGQAAEGFVYLV